MKIYKSILCLLLCVLCLTLSCCQSDSKSLTADYIRSEAIPVYDFFSGESVTPAGYEEFSAAYLDFAANLLKASSADESVALSPLSLYTALSMTANGASGKTLRELERVLGSDLSISEINTFIHYLSQRVEILNNENGKVKSANSLWIDDSYSVKAQYLQTVVNYFDSEVFRDELSSEEINNWIEENTEGLIKDMLSDLDEDTAMVLVNALLFDDEWLTPYEEEDIYDGSFKGTKGQQVVSFMESNEMLLTAADAKGFIKSYKNTPCKLVAILPNENVDIDTYVSTLSGAKLTTLLNSAAGVNRCVAHLPEFELRTKLNLKDTISEMGAPLAFSDEANFENLTMSENLKISQVIQESFVDVSSKGTVAGSSSAVVVAPSASASPESDFESLVFDRPFVFMIVENECNLPLFIGTVKSI